MKKTVYLPVPPTLKDKVPYIELTIMPAAERFAEKEAEREANLKDIIEGLESGRYTPEDVKAMNPIDWASYVEDVQIRGPHEKTSSGDDHGA